MPQFDFAHVFLPQVAWLAVFFVLLYFGVVRLTLPKLGKVMNDREEAITGDLAAAKVAKEHADAAVEAYRLDMAKAHEDARKVIADAKAKAGLDSEKKLAKADDAAHALIAGAEARIAKAVSDAHEALRDVAAESAREIVGRLTGAEPTLAAAKKLVAARFD